jgi:hypothetical protein
MLNSNDSDMSDVDTLEIRHFTNEHLALDDDEDNNSDIKTEAFLAPMFSLFQSALAGLQRLGWAEVLDLEEFTVLDKENLGREECRNLSESLMQSIRCPFEYSDVFLYVFP